MAVDIVAPGGAKFAFDATPDTGACISVISLDILTEQGLTPCCASTARLCQANGAPLKNNGSISLSITYGGTTIEAECVVSGDLHREILISWYHLRDLGVLSDKFPVPRAKIAKVTVDDSLDAIKRDYSVVLGDSLGEACGQMKGEPMHIALRTDIYVRPRKVFTARQVHVHYRKQADALTEELITAGVIVPVAEPTEWLSPAHFVPKENGKVRLATDYRQLNQYVDRPIHPFSPATDLIKTIHPSSKYFAKLDAVHGYFQVPLDFESSLLTTFLLPSGRYRYTGAPMGLNSSSDEFCCRSDEAVVGLKWVRKIVDDMLVQAPNEELMFQRIRVVLGRCRDHGIRISLSKLDCGTSVTFAGYHISQEGIKPDGEKVKAISDFPDPTTVSEVRSFLGLANQLGFFVPDIAHLSTPIRALLKRGVVFQYLDAHQEAFTKMKEVLCSDLVVKPLDPSLATELLTDASRLHGIGFALLQRKDGGKPRLVTCGSRSLSNAEKNYATVELEFLAIWWAAEKSAYYLRGMPTFTVVTDHKPLIGILNKDLQDIGNERLQRFREKLIPFTFTTTWNAGKSHLIADALSRAPISSPELEEIRVCLVSGFHQAPSLTSAIAQEPYTSWIRDFQLGKCTKDSPLRNVWSLLSLQDGFLVVDSHRIVVPPMERAEILSLLHVPHAGIVKTYQHARQIYYWSGMKNDIANMVGNCDKCAEVLPSLPMEPFVTSQAEGPMTHVGVDLFEFSSIHWILMVDRFSGYPFAKKLRSRTSAAIIAILRDWFSDYGYPEVIRSDGGPQFRTEIGEFCVYNNILHEISSPYNSQSNGLAEAGVKNVKHIIMKWGTGENLAIALQEWRNTPRADGISPSYAFLGRRQKGIIPCLPQPTLPFPRRPVVEIGRTLLNSVLVKT